MKDSVQRFLLENTDLRGEIVYLDKSIHDIMEQHYYPKPVKQFLAELLAATVLLRATIKLNGYLSIQLEQEGPVRVLVAQCDEQFYVRAVAQYDEDADLTELEEALNEGRLVVTIMPEDQAEPYQAIVPLQHNNIRKAIESYFKQSEQISTRLWLTVENDRCAGLLLQKLPSSMQVNSDDWEKVMQLPDNIALEELLTLAADKLLIKIFGEGTVRLFEGNTINFRCRCTVEKMADNIRLLGEEEAYDILSTHRFITVMCEFCNHEHEFSKADVDQIFSPSQ